MRPVNDATIQAPGSTRMIVCHYVFCSCGRKKRAATDARCLRCYALRDREFQRKARGWFRPTPRHSATWHRNQAWRAIAREEGRFFSVYSADGQARLGGDILITRAREYAAEIGGYVVGPDGVREAARAIAREEGRAL